MIYLDPLPDCARGFLVSRATLIYSGFSKELKNQNNIAQYEQKKHIGGAKMVSSELENVKHYYLNGEWFHRDPETGKVKCQIIESPERVTDYSRKCCELDRVTLSLCENLDRVQELRKTHDCREVSLAKQSVQIAIAWLENAMGQYAPPAIMKK